MANNQHLDKTSNMETPVPDVASREEELEAKMLSRMTRIEKQNEILGGVRELHSRSGEEKLIKQCKAFQDDCYAQWIELSRCNPADQSSDSSADENMDTGAEMRKYAQERLLKEFADIIWNFLEKELNVNRYTMRDGQQRCQELGDALLYISTIIHQANSLVPVDSKHLEEIVHNVYDPLNNFNSSREDIRPMQYTWDELLCVMLGDKEIFAQFCRQLDDNHLIVHFLKKHPQLISIKELSFTVSRLTEYSPYENMNEVLTNVRSGNGQTRMFFVKDDEVYTYVELYGDHIDALYALLKIQDANGQTALHINTENVTNLLASNYTPKQRGALIKLSSIMDNDHRTAQQVSDHKVLHSLIRRVKNNEYITAQDNTNIVIIYTTNRPGADEEARSIYSACESKFNTKNIKLEKDISQDQIIDCIKQSANIRSTYGPTTSLIVILLSHGGVGTIDDCDGNQVNLSVIAAAMCSYNLDGRPKLLITACCQSMEDINDAIQPYVPTHGDFCAVMSCVSGQPSTRGVFTRKLAEQIKNSTENTDIFELVRSVSIEMKREEHQQTPIIMSSLRAHYCPTDDWRSY